MCADLYILDETKPQERKNVVRREGANRRSNVSEEVGMGSRAQWGGGDSISEHREGSTRVGPDAGRLGDLVLGRGFLKR